MSLGMPFLPLSLQSLGYVGRVVGGVELILPPVCAIPAGAFTMGSDRRRDRFAQPNEMPQHTAETAAFHIGKYPVTVAEYACAERAHAVAPPDSSIEEERWYNQLAHLDHPVTNVFVHEARDYAAWLAQWTGIDWRLPTEAEWEKTARGTDGRIFPWGDGDDTTRANMGGMGYFWFDAEGRTSGPGTTTRVGSYPLGASPYGVQEMAGNVWEWCSSGFGPYPYDPTDGREDPHALGLPVLRGGSYFDQIRAGRAAARGRIHGPATIYGFRLVYSTE